NPKAPGEKNMKLAFACLAAALLAALPAAAQQHQQPHPSAHSGTHAPAMHAHHMTTHRAVHATHRVVRHVTHHVVRHAVRHAVRAAVRRAHRPPRVVVAKLRRNIVAVHRFHAGPYRAPLGWRYRRWGFGERLPSVYFGSSFWITDFLAFGLV